MDAQKKSLAERMEIINNEKSILCTPREEGQPCSNCEMLLERNSELSNEILQVQNENNEKVEALKKYIKSLEERNQKLEDAVGDLKMENNKLKMAEKPQKKSDPQNKQKQSSKRNLFHSCKWDFLDSFFLHTTA